MPRCVAALGSGPFFIRGSTIARKCAADLPTPDQHHWRAQLRCRVFIHAAPGLRMEPGPPRSTLRGVGSVELFTSNAAPIQPVGAVNTGGASLFGRIFFVCSHRSFDRLLLAWLGRLEARATPLSSSLWVPMGHHLWFALGARHPRQQCFASCASHSSAPAHSAGEGERAGRGGRPCSELFGPRQRGARSWTWPAFFGRISSSGGPAIARDCRRTSG